MRKTKFQLVTILFYLLFILQCDCNNDQDTTLNISGTFPSDVKIGDYVLIFDSNGTLFNGWSTQPFYGTFSIDINKSQLSNPDKPKIIFSIMHSDSACVKFKEVIEFSATPKVYNITSFISCSDSLSPVEGEELSANCE